MNEEQALSKRLRYNRIIARLDSVIAPLVAENQGFLLEEVRQEYRSHFNACVYAELGQISSQLAKPLILSSVVERHFRGLVLDTSKNVVAFKCPDVENFECDWNVSAALNDLIADDLREERPQEPMPVGAPTEVEHSSIIAPDEAVQAPAASASLLCVSDSQPSVQPGTPREELLSDFIDPAFLEESFTESSPRSLQPATENVVLLSDFLDPEILSEVMSMLKPDNGGASTSVPAGAAAQDETASDQPVPGRHAEKNRRQKARRAALRAEQHNFVLHDSEKPFETGHTSQPSETIQYSVDNVAKGRAQLSEASTEEEVLSVCNPEAPSSLHVNVTDQSALAHQQEPEAPSASKKKSKNTAKNAFKVLLYKFALYDFEEPSESVKSEVADEAIRCSRHGAAEKPDTPDREVNEADRSFGGNLRKRYWTKLTNPSETVLERIAEHSAESDEQSGQWRPQMSTKCRVAHGCANDRPEESLGQHDEMRGLTTPRPQAQQDIRYFPRPSDPANRTFTMEYPKFRVRRDSLWAMSWEDIEEDYPRAVFFGLRAIDFVTRGKLGNYSAFKDKITKVSEIFTAPKRHRELAVKSS